MRRFSLGLTALAIIAAPIVAAPAVAQTAATPAEAASAGQFISTLSDNAFAVLKETSSKPAIKAKFRAMLKDNFAVEDAGARLIRRYRNQITPAQLAAYQAVLPDYVVNIYADRLINYSDATVKIVRTQPHGSTGGVDVFTKVEVAGKAPFDIIWYVQKGSSGKWLVGNVTVSGVNLSLTQEADFSAIISKQGFDGLVALMKASNAKSA
ncbi:MlaC/ttg2D family ABC transporter substrate-binding protein [Glacieibacterium megasporae]|uniref:MlaC/ttg2D family ABC transporter substrate-binding protein n=1 Tax=Glacieibacterium megasporae TaxID=2835787 RepID=UPI001C1DD266|nr:ABC transporter substrate-binding protein [Polymorphobacter megasporae]UAJ09418.1 ABC transporter substrate-binding protein [Polymorphobacter megasporae]